MAALNHENAKLRRPTPSKGFYPTPYVGRPRSSGYDERRPFLGLPDCALGGHSDSRTATADPTSSPAGPAVGGLWRLRRSGFDGLQVCPRHLGGHHTAHELEEDLDTSSFGDGIIRYFREAFEQLRGDVYRLTCLELGPSAVVSVHRLQTRLELANDLIWHIHDCVFEVNPSGNVPHPAHRRLAFDGKRAIDEQIPRKQRQLGASCLDVR